MKTERKCGTCVRVCVSVAGWGGVRWGVMLPAATVMHKNESTGANVAPTNQSDNGWRAQLSWQFPNCDGKPANVQLSELLVGRQEWRRRSSFGWCCVHYQILTEQEEAVKMPQKPRGRDLDYCDVTQVKQQIQHHVRSCATAVLASPCTAVGITGFQPTQQCF